MWYMAILSAPIVFGLCAIAPEAILLAGDGYAGIATAVLQVLVFVLIPIFLDFPYRRSSTLQGNRRRRQRSWA